MVDIDPEHFMAQHCPTTHPNHSWNELFSKSRTETHRRASRYSEIRFPPMTDQARAFVDKTLATVKATPTFALLLKALGRISFFFQQQPKHLQFKPRFFTCDSVRALSLKDVVWRGGSCRGSEWIETAVYQVPI